VTKWSSFTNEEIERRRAESVAALERLGHEDFEKWYQEVCDTDYWKFGQCCAGCDHWMSDGGRTGRCKAAGIVSGEDVMRSMGITWSTYPYSPGFPYTEIDHHCGLFKDEFDWSDLDRDYLQRIGALRNGELKPKPRHARQV